MIAAALPRALCAAVAAAAALGGAGCAGIVRNPQPAEPPPLVWASCPPLGDAARADLDALRLRVAELEARYSQCRQAVFGGAP